MTRLSMTRAGCMAAVLVALGAAPALGQGTAAEREACTEDAVKLCSDTIPDVAKTTACMQAHASQLTPRCRRFVVARADQGERTLPPAVSRRGERYGAAPGEDTGRRARRDDGDRHYNEAPPRYEEGRRREDYAPEDGGFEEERGYDGPPGYGGGRFADPGERRFLYRGPDGGAAEAPEGRDRERARAEIDRLCADEEIDPRTCALTDRALH